jgi:hypothetical protein
MMPELLAEMTPEVLAWMQAVITATQQQQPKETSTAAMLHTLSITFVDFEAATKNGTVQIKKAPEAPFAEPTFVVSTTTESDALLAARFDGIRMSTTCLPVFLKKLLVFGAEVIETKQEPPPITKKRKSHAPAKPAPPCGTISAEYDSRGVFRWSPFSEPDCEDVAKIFGQRALF